MRLATKNQDKLSAKIEKSLTRFLKDEPGGCEAAILITGGHFFELIEAEFVGILDAEEIKRRTNLYSSSLQRRLFETEQSATAKIQAQKEAAK